MAKLIISLAQMQIELGNVRRNYNMMERMVAEATKRNSHVVVFPELWSTGYALNQADELAETLNHGMFTQISKVATQNKISVLGSILEKRGTEVANTAAFFASNGRLMGVYRKIHLFSLMDEDKHLQAGASPLIMNLPWGDSALAICYDLRFPELFRRYAVEGARLVFVLAEWPRSRVEHWRSLIIARAIENQYYMIACNTVGEVGDTTFAGHSMIVDPWGKIVVEAGEEPFLVTAEIELDRVEEARSKIPVLDDRRPEIYESLDIGF